MFGDSNIWLVAFLDILIGAAGVVVILVAHCQFRKTSKRLKTICEALGIEDKGSIIIPFAIGAIIFCYIFGLAGWIHLIYQRHDINKLRNFKKIPFIKFTSKYR